MEIARLFPRLGSIQGIHFFADGGKYEPRCLIYVAIFINPVAKGTIVFHNNDYTFINRGPSVGGFVYGSP